MDRRGWWRWTVGGEEEVAPPDDPDDAALNCPERHRAGSPTIRKRLEDAYVVEVVAGCVDRFDQ